jgi:hypothetical protein
MGRFVRTAVFAVAMSAPVVVGALIDQSGLSVLGAPDAACTSAICGTGTYGDHASDKAQGGLSIVRTVANPGGPSHLRITTTTSGNEGKAGHVVTTINGEVVSTQSGQLTP